MVIVQTMAREKKCFFKLKLKGLGGGAETITFPERLVHTRHVI